MNKKVFNSVAMASIIALTNLGIIYGENIENNKDSVSYNEEKLIDIEEYKTKLIIESLKNNGLNSKSADNDVDDIKNALKEYVNYKYTNVKSNEDKDIEIEILEYILDKGASHDPIPQYYAAIDLDMKTEKYIFDKYKIKISENIDESIKILVNEIDNIIMNTGLSKDDVINKIVALASLSTEGETIDFIDSKLGLGLQHSMESSVKENVSTYAYNESKAISYANRYNGLKRNAAYRDFSKSGGDCANFVSQILYDGGMTFRNGSPIDNSKYWFCNGKNLNQISSTWRGASMFRWHWQSRAGKVTNVSAADTKSKFKTAVYDKAYQGDAISLLTTEKTPYHTMFITTRNTSSQDFKYAAHSDRGEENSSVYNSLKKRISGIPVIIYYL